MMVSRLISNHCSGMSRHNFSYGKMPGKYCLCLTSELSWHVLTATYCNIKVKHKGWKEMCSVGCTVTADSCSVWSFHLLCSGNKFGNLYSGTCVLYSVYVKASGTTACPCITEVLCSSQCAHVMKSWNMQFVFPFAPMLYLEMHSYRDVFHRLSYDDTFLCSCRCSTCIFN